MKIALVTGEFPPMEGGVGAFTQELARALYSQGHEIHIITSKNAMPADSEQKHYGRHPEPYDLGYAQLHARIGRWHWPSTAKVADYTLRNEFDVVNIQYQAAAYNMNSLAVNLMPWRLKHVTRAIVTFHDLRTPYLFPKAGSLRGKAITLMARQATGVIVTNSEDFESLQSQIKSPLAAIPIGSNIDVYRANHVEIGEVRDLLGLDRDNKLLGYFGFVNESKGADTLVHALSLLPQSYHLAFIGGQTGASDAANSPFLDQVKKLISELELNDRVHWTGFIPDERASTFLQATDMMVMPYRDGASLRRGTLMATLAHGRPLISTRPAAPVPELVHGENIWLVPPGDPSTLAKAIEQLLDDPALRQQLGKNAAITSGHFSWDKIAKRTSSFFKSLDDPRTRLAH